MDRHPNFVRLLLGLGIIGLGLLFTLDKLDIVDVRDYWSWWPVILIAIGVARILEPSPRSGPLGGVILLVIGGWFLAYNLELVEYRLWDFWPVLLVVVGGSMVWRATSGRGEEAPSESAPTPAGPGPALGGVPGSVPPGAAFGAPVSIPPPTVAASDSTAAPTMSAFALFGGLERRSTAPDFRGGDITAMLGSCNVDLRGAGLASGRAVIDTFAFWGGIELHVPEDWAVEVQGTPLLGGFADKTRRGGSPNKVLVVRGVALMGGVEISN